MQEGDKIYLGMASKAAIASPDPSTKVGAVIVTSGGGWLKGYNNFPAGVVVTKDRLKRPEKYNYMVHAEKNVIFHAASMGIPLNGSRMYITKCPCHDCAAAIIQAGIKEIHTYNSPPDSRWKDSQDIGLTMLKEAGVNVIFHE